MEKENEDSPMIRNTVAGNNNFLIPG